jgi:uncharacterized protein (UPF0216 family)
MPSGHSPSNDSVFLRWMKLEIGRINEGMVSERKTLSQLLMEETPSSVTRAGKEYQFDLAVLQQIAKAIPAPLQDRLRLPILFYADIEVPNSCYLTDPVAVTVLQNLGEISSLREMRKGRLWVARPIAYSIFRKFPTAIQIVMSG